MTGEVLAVNGGAFAGRMYLSLSARSREQRTTEIAVLRVLREYAVFPVLVFCSIQDSARRLPNVHVPRQLRLYASIVARASGLDVKPVRVRL